MSMTFDEYIEKRVNQAVEEAVHKVSVNFANNICQWLDFFFLKGIYIARDIEVIVIFDNFFIAC